VPVPKRNIERAKQLLKEAGVPNPSFTLVTPTTSDAQRIALVVQAMTREAGFDVKIQAAEFATSLNMADKGDFEAYVLAWSGRPDPDGNLFYVPRLQAAAQLRRLLRRRDRQADQRVARRARPGQAQEDLRAGRRRVMKERPVVYLYHRKWLWAYNPKLQGVRNVPDGLLRVSGLKMQ
jgi:peptide/nickel transport system substrate-binding protein